MKNIFYIIVLFLFLTALYFFVRPKLEHVDAVTIELKSFVETFEVDGKIRASNKQTVYAFASGEIDTMLMKVGDVVKKGDLLNYLQWDKKVPIKSPIDGVITKIYRDSAGPVMRGEPLFEISNLKQLEVVANVLTTEAVRLDEKTPARILNWGGESELNARIVKISRAGSVKVSALGVEEERTEVLLHLDSIPDNLAARLGDNYHVDVLFFLSKFENVLTVPLGALFRVGNDWAVFKVVECCARTQIIKLDKKNDSEAMVIDGLSPGDEVILFPGDKIREGQKVLTKTSDKKK